MTKKRFQGKIRGTRHVGVKRTFKVVVGSTKKPDDMTETEYFISHLTGRVIAECQRAFLPDTPILSVAEIIAVSEKLQPVIAEELSKYIDMLLQRSEHGNG